MELFGFLSLVIVIILFVRISNIRLELRRLEDRLSRVEQSRAVPAPEVSLAAPEAPKAASQEVPAPAKPTWVGETVYKPVSMETVFGGNILTKVGVIALLFGIGFLFQYAYVNQWIGPMGWVILGITTGLILLVLGEYFHGSYRVYAQTLTGGGIGVLYLSIFAAFTLYHLIGQYVAFSIMGLITATSAVLAIRYNAIAIALVGVFGGFLTPILISTGENNLPGLFSYLALLDIGILAVSIFKQWRELNFAGLVGTFIIFMMWFMRFYTHDQLWQTEFFITALFVIFSLSTIVYLLFRTAPIVTLDMAMIVGVPTVYFLVSVGLLERDYENYLGFFALVLAVWYFLLTYIGYQINKSDKNLVNSLGFVALVFLTTAIPLQLEQSWITFMWTLEALVLLIVGLLAHNQHMRLFSIIVLGLVGVRLFLFEFEIGNLSDYAIIFNKRFFIFLFVVAVMSVMAYLYKRLLREQESIDSRSQGSMALLGASQLLLFIILNVELLTFWDKQTLLVQQSIQQGVKQETFIQNNNPYLYQRTAPYSNSEYTALQSIRNKRNISLSILWAFYGVMALLVGILTKQRYARMLSIGLFGLVILKVFLFDMSSLTGFYRITSFIGLGVTLITVGFVYQRFKAQIREFITE